MSWLDVARAVVILGAALVSWVVVAMACSVAYLRVLRAREERVAHDGAAPERPAKRYQSAGAAL